VAAQCKAAAKKASAAASYSWQAALLLGLLLVSVGDRAPGRHTAAVHVYLNKQLSKRDLLPYLNKQHSRRDRRAALNATLTLCVRMLHPCCRSLAASA
jgi:hypothetical protein